MTRYLKQNAVCVINCSWDPSELEKQLPAKMRRDLAEKKASHAIHKGSGTAVAQSVIKRYANKCRPSSSSLMRPRLL